MIIVCPTTKPGKSLSASTTGSGTGGGSSAGGGGGSGVGGGGGSGNGGGNSGNGSVVSGANSGGTGSGSSAGNTVGGGSLSGGGIVAVKQETTVELASLGHGSYTMVDSTTFLSGQQQRVNNPPEDDEVPSLPSMSHARCETMFVSLRTCMLLYLLVPRFATIVIIQPVKIPSPGTERYFCVQFLYLGRFYKFSPIEFENFGRFSKKIRT